MRREAELALGGLRRVGGEFWPQGVTRLPSPRPLPPTSPPGSAPPSMSHSFGESYRVGSTSGVHAVTVFCSWDHKVTQKRASRLQHDHIRTHLKVSRSGPGAAASPPPAKWVPPVSPGASGRGGVLALLTGLQTPRGPGNRPGFFSRTRLSLGAVCWQGLVPPVLECAGAHVARTFCSQRVLVGVCARGGLLLGKRPRGSGRRNPGSPQ